MSFQYVLYVITKVIICYNGQIVLSGCQTFNYKYRYSKCSC